MCRTGWGRELPPHGGSIASSLFSLRLVCQHNTLHPSELLIALDTSCAAVLDLCLADRMARKEESQPSDQEIAAPHHQRNTDGRSRRNPEEAEHGYLAGFQGPHPTGQRHQECEPAGGPGRHELPERKADTQKRRDKSVFAYSCR